MKNIKLMLLLIPILGISACHKEAFLDAKPSSSIEVPTSLADFQSLLDNAGNYASYGSGVTGVSTPYLGEASSDNYYVADKTLTSLLPLDRNAYVWAKDLYSSTPTVNDWDVPYKQILYTNIVLDNIKNIAVNQNNILQWNNIYGGALFLRSYAFYNLVSEFSPCYDKGTALTDLGIILKTSSDINTNPGRASVQQTYDKIIMDLKSSLNYLSVARPNSNNPNRASKSASFALLSRIYLSMRSYPEAKAYADSSLKIYNTVVDYNILPIGGFYPFKLKQVSTSEVLYQSELLANQSNFWAYLSPFLVDSNFYKSFDQNDLRKQINFINPFNEITLGWSYSADFSAFSGLATDEMYLIRAECNARAGNTPEAMSDLNIILSKRFKSGTFIPLTATTSQVALNTVLTERRKELAFRGLRWTDLKRLNKEGANIILTRNINGQTYTLPPNSLLYVLPIPPDEITTSGIQQNLR